MTIRQVVTLWGAVGQLIPTISTARMAKGDVILANRFTYLPHSRTAMHAAARCQWETKGAVLSRHVLHVLLVSLIVAARVRIFLPTCKTAAGVDNPVALVRFAVRGRVSILAQTPQIAVDVERSAVARSCAVVVPV